MFDMNKTPATTAGFTVEQFQAAREIIRDYVEAETPMSIYELLARWARRDSPPHRTCTGCSI